MEPVLLFEIALAASLLFGSATAGRKMAKLIGGANTEPDKTLRELLDAAYVTAHRLGHPHASLEHLLLVASAMPTVSTVLSTHRVSANTLAASLPAPNLELDPRRRLAWEPGLEGLMQQAMRSAQKRGGSHLTIHDVLNEAAARNHRAFEPFGGALVHFAQDSELLDGHFVYLWNDHQTPMNHVVEILEGRFGLSTPRAHAIMYTAHFVGFAAIGPYNHLQRAEELVEKATEETYTAGHGLQFSLAPPMEARRAA